MYDNNIVFLIVFILECHVGSTHCISNDIYGSSSIWWLIVAYIAIGWCTGFEYIVVNSNLATSCSDGVDNDLILFIKGSMSFCPYINSDALVDKLLTNSTVAAEFDLMI